MLIPFDVRSFPNMPEFAALPDGAERTIDMRIAGRWNSDVSPPSQPTLLSFYGRDYALSVNKFLNA